MESAREALRELSTARVSRETAQPSAALAWRAGFPELGIRWLHPYVRGTPTKPPSASAAQTAEYAQCLIRLGAVGEGEALLRSLDEMTLPDVLFYRASAHVARWEYPEAAVLLARYVRAPKVSAYRRLVGHLNLSAAFIYQGKIAKAEPLLRSLLHETSVRGHGLLLMRALELAAEKFFVERKWTEAERFLDRAHRLSKSCGGLDSFFVDKFKATLAAFRSRSTHELRLVRLEAARRGHFETVRDCDRIESVVLKDERLARHVWFGTPYASYRQQLAEAFSFDTSSPYDWSPGEPGPVLDLSSGISAGKRWIEPSGLLHRLLLALSEDFYRPIRMAALFGRVYPERFFDPTQSANTLHNAINRLRAVLKEEGGGAQVVESGGFYRLDSTRPFSLRVHRDAEIEARYAVDYRSLQARFGKSPFTVSEAVICLSKPGRTVLRILQNLCERKQLERLGTGRSTRYVFTPHS